MARKKLDSDFLYQTYKLMGQDVGKNIPFLKETSCMDTEKREEYAFLEIMGNLEDFVNSHSDFTLKQFIDEFLKPSLQIWGWSLWKRDVITDLALRLGRKSFKSSFKKVKEHRE